MGKRYYCDYCDKTMSCAPSIIRTHNNGLSHQKLVQEHYMLFKDPATILAEESKKTPCAQFPKGQCQFGSICRFSHYSSEALETLKKYVATKHQASAVTSQPCFQDLYNNFQTEKSNKVKDDHTILVDSSGVTHTLPWTYNSVLDSYGDSLPPSVKRIKLEDFKYASFSEWG